MKKQLFTMLFVICAALYAEASLAFSMNEEASEEFSLNLSVNAPVAKSSALISYVSEPYTSASDIDYKYFATIGKVTSDPIASPTERSLSLQAVEAGLRVAF